MVLCLYCLFSQKVCNSKKKLKEKVNDKTFVYRFSLKDK